MIAHHRKGFTLIELLVVIAIIALLTAILVPSLSRAREQARFIVCKSNLKSYGVLAFMYIEDNDGIMPSAWTSFYNQHSEYRNEPHRYCRWHNPDFDLEQHPEYAGPFWPYLKGKDVHICPSYPKFAREYGPNHPQHVDSVPIIPNYSYSMNSFLGSTDTKKKRATDIKRHSDIFFFGEENLWITSPYNTHAFNDTAMCVYEKMDSFGTFHSSRDPEKGVTNAVFLDGHVQTVHREDSWRLCAPDGAEKSPLNGQ